MPLDLAIHKWRRCSRPNSRPGSDVCIRVLILIRYSRDVVSRASGRIHQKVASNTIGRYKIHSFIGFAADIWKQNYVLVNIRRYIGVQVGKFWGLGIRVARTQNRESGRHRHCNGHCPCRHLLHHRTRAAFFSASTVYNYRIGFDLNYIRMIDVVFRRKMHP